MTDTVLSLLVRDPTAGGVEVFERFMPKPGGFTHAWAGDIQLSTAPWLVKGLMPALGFGFIYGAPGAGKSFYAIDMAMRLAAGLEVHERRTRKVGVIYVAAESPEGIKKRVVAALDVHGVTDPIAFAIIPEAPSLGSRDSGGNAPRGFTALVERIEVIEKEMFENFDLPLGLVIFDTLAASMVGLDENSAGDASAVTADLQAISNRFRCFAMAVHHTGVQTTDKRMRGSSAFNAGGDLTIQVARDGDGQHRLVTCQKVRDDEDGRQHAFRLDAVDLGRDAEGDPVTSAVCAFVDLPEAKTSKRPLTGAAKILLDALGYLIDHGQSVPAPQMPGLLNGPDAVLEPVLKKRVEEMSLFDSEDKPGCRRTRWFAAKAKLRDEGLLRIEGKYYILLRR